MEDPDVTEMKKNCNNKEYVLQAVKQKGKLLEFAAQEFHDDEEVVKTALEQKCSGAVFIYSTIPKAKNSRLFGNLKKVQICFFTTFVL